MSAQEPGSRRHTFLPLIAADETLMCFCLSSTWHMQTPQIQATAMCCVQNLACQTWARLRSDTDRPRSSIFLAWHWRLSLIASLRIRSMLTWVVFLSSSYQGKGGWTAGGWCWLWHLRKPYQTDQVWHQTVQGMLDKVSFYCPVIYSTEVQCESERYLFELSDV